MAFQMVTFPSQLSFARATGNIAGARKVTATSSAAPQ